MKTHLSTLIGSFLFLAYILQALIPIQWPLLQQWQQDEMYDRWSGFVLFIIIVLQWMLTIFRMTKPQSLITQQLLKVHQWLGVTIPIFFYFHTTQLGRGYLLMLCLIFYFNFLLGLLHKIVYLLGGEKWFKAWYLSHIVGSLVMLLLIIFHIGIVFYYE